MKQIVVISGKGGTGKTVMTASFAALAKNAVFADCDVDAADLYLLLPPLSQERHPFQSGRTARIDAARCRQCGRCREICRFGAVSKEYRIDPIACEGCEICQYVCPEQAIIMDENESGEWFVSQTRYGPMVHAKLGIAEEHSGKLVTLVRQQATAIAEREKRDYVIIDGPPGVGCPVIASLANVGLALIVTEPTMSGIHDMERVIDTAEHFGIPVKVVINKYDINQENTRKITEVSAARKIEVLGTVPFSREVPESIVKGIPLVEYSSGIVAKGIIDLWEKLR